MTDANPQKLWANLIIGIHDSDEGGALIHVQQRDIEGTGLRAEHAFTMQKPKSRPQRCNMVSNGLLGTKVCIIQSRWKVVVPSRDSCVSR